MYAIRSYYAAGIDPGKRGQIRTDIQRQAMDGDPFFNGDAHTADFPLPDPETVVLRIPSGLYTKLPGRSHHDSLKTVDKVGHPDPGRITSYNVCYTKLLRNYQVTSATIWNATPRDDMGQRGPIEEALIGVPVPDVDNPVNVGRLIRAYDP